VLQRLRPQIRNQPSRPETSCLQPQRANDEGRSQAAARNLDTGGVTESSNSGEAILRCERREIRILVASEEITITEARDAAGEQVAGPHVHHEHTDAFYVLEGELTFEIGREAETVTVPAGGFVAVPPGVAHSLRNGSDRPARWLTIHAPDGGFAAFMGGVRDGVKVEWDKARERAIGALLNAIPPVDQFSA
jgi:mannose-6-phosphate isomerase-like protein (cupin superfamily)